MSSWSSRLQKHTLQTSFQLGGYWRLADQADEDLTHGIVYFDPDTGARLETDGAIVKPFEPGFVPFFRPVESPATIGLIIGVTEDGRKIGLLNCVEVGGRTSIPGYEVYVYRAEFLLVTRQSLEFRELEKLTFDSFHVNLTFLDRWANVSPVTHEWGKYENGDDWVQTRVIFRESMSVPIGEIQDFRLSFWTGVSFPTSAVGQEIVWRQITYFEIEPFSQKNLSWLKDRAQSLQYLLSMFLGEPVFPSVINAFIESADKKPVATQVFYAVPRNRWSDTIDWSAIFVPRSSLSSGQLGESFRLWFDREEFIKPLADHFLGLIFNKQLVALAFLSLTQALEGYHRRRVGGQYLLADEEDDEYRPYREKLEEVVRAFEAGEPSRQEAVRDMKQSLLNGCIKYGYQYSFMKRLKDLWALLDEEVRNLLSIDQDYLARVKDTRNYYTHYDPADEDRALKGTNLHTANLRLTAFVLVLILRELDFPSDVLKAVLDGMKQSRRLV